jgi:hypothetical protein
MALRNRVAAIAGLKDLGALGAIDVVLSTHKSRVDASRVPVTATTVVKVRNLLGPLYMIPVRPVHRRIAPAVLASLAS